MNFALRLVPAAAVPLCVVVVAACYGPTAMRVEVLTDVRCEDNPNIAIYAGVDSDVSGESSRCESAAGIQSMGDILFAPDGDRGATVTVKVQLALAGDPKQCQATKDKCVFASRKFTYVEHETRRLSVRLYKECLGVVCDENSTCVQGGRCVGNEVQCQGSDCTVQGETPFVPTPDDGGVPPPVDAGPDVDAATPNPCLASDGTDTVVSAHPQFVAASATAFYYLEYNGATFTLNKIDRQTLLPGKGFAQTFTNPLALAADDTKPWIVYSDGISTYLWNPNDGPMLVGADPNVSSQLVVEPAAPNRPTAVYFTLGTTVNEYIEGGGLVGGVGTSAAVLALTYDATTLYALEVGAAEQFPRRTLGKAAPLGNAAGATALATSGTTAFMAGTDTKTTDLPFLRFLPAGTSLQAAAGPLSQGQLAADDVAVYWVEGNEVKRELSSGVFVSAPATVATLGFKGVTLSDLSVDPGAGLCGFVWSELPSGPPNRPRSLRIWRKVP